jgi:hypothetical protein
VIGVALGWQAATRIKIIIKTRIVFFILPHSLSWRVGGLEGWKALISQPAIFQTSNLLKASSLK